MDKITKKCTTCGGLTVDIVDSICADDGIWGIDKKGYQYCLRIPEELEDNIDERSQSHVEKVQSQSFIKNTTPSGRKDGNWRDHRSRGILKRASKEGT